MSFEGMLPISDATIKYSVNVSDGAGGSKITWADRVTNYKCRIYSEVGVVQITPTGQNVLTTNKCIGEYNSGIIENDVLVDGNNSYRIMRVDPVYDKERIHHLEMRLRKENFNFG